MPAQTELPRRHAQRRAILRGQINTPQETNRQPRKPRRMFNGRKIASQFDQELNSSVEGDFDSQNDSGYNSSTIEDWDGVMERYEEEGPVMANLCDDSRNAVETELEIWQIFCNRRKVDAEEALRECRASRFKTYLHWRVVNSRIKKLSSIKSYWKRLSQAYQQLTCSWMKDSVLLDIKNWIPIFTRPPFFLDDSEKEKSALFVDDLTVLLNHHWVRDTEVFAHERLRVQMALLLIFALCTATRPGALVGKRPLLYEDIELLLVRDSRGRNVLALKLNLKHIKRSGGKSHEKIFTFYESADLVLCPVLLFLSQAFADKAFEASVTPEGIYDLIIPPRKDCLRIRWNTKWAKRPVFRDVEVTTTGVRVSNTIALNYGKHKHHYQRLGRGCGFENLLQFYDLRRASGKNITEALTAEECNQIMGHRSRSTYTRYYIPRFIDRDCMAINLGMPLRKDIVRAVGRLARDEQAPTRLTDAQKFEVMNDPRLLELCHQRDTYKRQIKDLGFRYVKDAKGENELYERHRTKNDEIKNLTQQLKNLRLTKAIDEFHNTIDTIEINRQLEGFMPKEEVLAPSNIEYELEERGTVAKLFFQSVDGVDASQVFTVRLRLLNSLIRLCNRYETSRQHKASRNLKANIHRTQRRHRLDDYHDIDTENLVDWDMEILVDEKESETDCSDAETLVDAREYSKSTELYCAFCKWQDEEASQLKRNKLFARIDSLGRHVRSQHLEYIAPDERVICPYPNCAASLDDTTHFLNHTALQHDLCL